MPNPIISHQAPALYLKMKFPLRIDGVAICVGTIVPDLVLTNDLRHVSHSFLGQLYWTVPLTVILSMLFCRYIVSNLSIIARKEGLIPKILRYFGVDDWGLLKSKKFDKKYFVIAFYSALLGGLTHLLIDFPSHPYIELFYPWLIIPFFEFVWIPLLDFGFFTIWGFSMIWIVEDILLFITSLYLLRTIKKKDLIKNYYALKS